MEITAANIDKMSHRAEALMEKSLALGSSPDATEADYFQADLLMIKYKNLMKFIDKIITAWEEGLGAAAD